MSGLFIKPKAVKVRGVSDSRRHGVAARSLNELIHKTCDYLKVPRSGAHMCLSSDGTPLTDRGFGALPEHCELVLLSRDQSWKGVVSDLERLLTTEHRQQLLEAVRTLLSDPRSPETNKLLRDMIHNLEDTSEEETRGHDQDWFQGVDARFKTKSSYMRFNCEGRIRSYMKEVREASRSIEQARTRAQLEKTLQSLGHMLKKDKYNGAYFDRTEEEPSRMCTSQGWFSCQGSFDEALCRSLHSINPYSSRASRVLFSTWNLDHRIEKKRSIVPALLQCHLKRPSSGISLDYFYRLLFTRHNLKLVHITCHKKGAHNLHCDPTKIYRGTREPARGKAREPARGKAREPARGKAREPARGEAREPARGKRRR
ncbi:DNA fragmentation factor subunit beta [Eucyclogobius newberryi]|uniref:DNA fragmentation factor subunit beta n=1 Tax=Eucyclogobius newberryi TaxID=166745 RepID=UPI003B5986B6